MTGLSFSEKPQGEIVYEKYKLSELKFPNHSVFIARVVELVAISMAGRCAEIIADGKIKHYGYGFNRSGCDWYDIFVDGGDYRNCHIHASLVQGLNFRYVAAAGWELSKMILLTRWDRVLELANEIEPVKASPAIEKYFNDLRQDLTTPTA